MTLLRSAVHVSLLAAVACGGGSKSTRGTPDWTSRGSGVTEDSGAKWYFEVSRVRGGSPLSRRKAVDKRVRDTLAGVCKDVKPEDPEVVDHYVDQGGTEFALARIDASKCPDAPAIGGAKDASDKAKPEGGGDKAEAKAEEKPAEEAKPAEEKPAEEAKPEEKPAEEEKPAQ